ncbi:MAG: RNA 2',3'-cyclic phosphodiesterase [Actinomycetota bacterium]
MAGDRAGSSEAKPLRLFAAVEIPQRAKDQIERAVAPWRERLPNARWVKPENWHVTVKFMGRTYPRLVDRVHEACGAAASGIRRFRFELDGLGVFPRPTKARVFWVGLQDEGGLKALASALDRELERDFPPEKRGFTPHLTVARLNPPAPVDAEDLGRSEVEASSFGVGEVVLFQSHLSPRGARYEPLARFPLRG